MKTSNTRGGKRKGTTRSGEKKNKKRRDKKGARFETHKDINKTGKQKGNNLSIMPAAHALPPPHSSFGR